MRRHGILDQHSVTGNMVQSAASRNSRLATAERNTRLAAIVAKRCGEEKSAGGIRCAGVARASGRPQALNTVPAVRAIRRCRTLMPTQDQLKVKRHKDRQASETPVEACNHRPATVRSLNI